MIVLGLFWKKATKLGAYIGLIIGEILVFVLILGKMDPFAFAGMNFNAGFVALVVNMTCYVLISLATYRPVEAGSNNSYTSQRL